MERKILKTTFTDLSKEASTLIQSTAYICTIGVIMNTKKTVARQIVFVRPRALMALTFYTSAFQLDVIIITLGVFPAQPAA